MLKKSLLAVAGVAAFLVVLSLGILTGREVQSRLRGSPTRWTTGLVPGNRFPDVTLYGPEGDSLSADELFRKSGKVVLFIDPRCPACAPATLRWQELVDEGRLESASLVAITTASDGESRQYADALRLSFPIYRDPRDVFQNEWGVSGLPYEVIVDGSGTIQSTNIDTGEDINVGQVRKELGTSP